MTHNTGAPATITPEMAAQIRRWRCDEDCSGSLRHGPRPICFGGDTEKAAKVYQGVAEPLTADDVADTIAWAVTRPPHVNIDLMIVRPRAQASNTKVHREP